MWLAFHAIQYMCGKQSVEKLQRLRSFGGAQSYPSITKDDIDVDYSTGSVGLGAAATLFGAIFQDYLIGHGLAPLPIPGSGRAAEHEAPARYIALVGDAELDEGNVYEALYEGNKQQVCGACADMDARRLPRAHASPPFVAPPPSFATIGGLSTTTGRAWIACLPMGPGEASTRCFARTAGV